MDKTETPVRANADETRPAKRWTADNVVFCAMTVCFALSVLILWHERGKLDACRAALGPPSGLGMMLEADEPPPRRWDI